MWLCSKFPSWKCHHAQEPLEPWECVSQTGLYASFAATSSLNSEIYSQKPKGDGNTTPGWEQPAPPFSQKWGAAWEHPVASFIAERLSAAEPLLLELLLPGLAELAQMPAHTTAEGSPLPQPVCRSGILPKCPQQCEGGSWREQIWQLICTCSLTIVTLSRCKLPTF